MKTLRLPSSLAAVVLQLLPIGRAVCTNPALPSSLAIALRWTLGLTAALGASGMASGAALRVVGWSDVGMHEIDGSDVSVYSILPPYNTIHAQLMSGGRLVTNATGIAVTYQAVADPTGSINTTSQGKGNFYQYAQALYGVALSPDQGLAGFAMPGPANQPQAMAFDPAQKCFTAEGIPITPYDDQGRKNSAPMMRLIARDSAGNALGSTDIVLPVTDEMDCRACHASGSQVTARPMAGWVWNCEPENDYKLNILRSHDEHQAMSSAYSNVLTQVGYNTAGLLATVLEEARPISCVRCHASAALPGSGAAGMRPLAQLMHTKHAYVWDEGLGSVLTVSSNSATCFLCHAGPETSFLRGVHHNAVSTNGSLAMQCQSCHGSVASLGTAGRSGWLDEPNCQSCHTGTAASNNGQLRFTAVFDASGQVRQAVNQTYATQTNTPSAGLDLFRLSHGHGGLACAACHGSAHAELVSSQPNDNLQSQQVQGHVGVLTDCSACHTTAPASRTGGPHGMHPVDQNWARNHGEGNGRAGCQACHGTDYRGTELSRMQADRTFSTSEGGGTRLFARGSQVGCYDCHNGPNSEDNRTASSVATAGTLSTSTTAGSQVAITLPASDPAGNPLTFHIVAQPNHGRASLTGSVATYFAAPGYVGPDSFSFTTWNGSRDSNPGTVNVTVSAGDCVLTAGALAPAAALPNSVVPFRASASLAQCVGSITYDWDFGDASPHESETSVCHTYSAPGDYAWTLTATANGTSQTVNGVVTISSTLGPVLPLTITSQGFMMLLSWPVDRIPATLETTSDPSQTNSWQFVTDPPVTTETNMSVQVYVLPGPQFYRLRRVP